MRHEKTVRTMFMGHEIVAHNQCGLENGEVINEAVLSIDGAIVDRTEELSARKARLGAALIDGDNRHSVEVQFGGIFVVRMKIVIDGKKVAGDLR